MNAEQKEKLKEIKQQLNRACYLLGQPGETSHREFMEKLKIGLRNTMEFFVEEGDVSSYSIGTNIEDLSVDINMTLKPDNSEKVHLEL